MKKALLFLPVSLLFPALLFGSVWNSNALGQKISAKERIEGVGWERVDEGDVSTLYYEGKVEKTRMTLKDGYEEKSESESLRIFINEEGHIVRKILESEKGSEEYNYFYSSSLLSGYTYSLDGAVVETCEYLRTPDGVVLGLIKDKNPIFFSGDRVYEMVDGSLETFFMDEEEKERNIEWKEDGGYIEVKRENGGSVEYTYDGNGRLVSKESPDSLISYFYSSEGSLIKTREERKNEIKERIIEPLLKGMKEEGISYKGVMTLSLVISDNGPYLVDFHVRLNDPATQAMVPIIKTDVMDIMMAMKEDKLSTLKLETSSLATVAVVLATPGYPINPETGREIKGIDNSYLMNLNDKPLVFVGAVKRTSDGRYFTDGGRNITVVGYGDTIQEANERAYSLIDHRPLESLWYRHDIGNKFFTWEN